MQQQLADAPEVREAIELSLQPRIDQPVALRAEQQSARVVTPTDLLAIAYQSGDKDIERLERLMAMDIRYRELQENDRARDASIAFEADFVGFTGESIIIPKTKHVDRGRGGSFDQAEFDEVCRRLKPALAKHGFGFRHKERFGVHPVTIDDVERPVAWVWVTCILSHRSGHKDILELDGPADQQSANSPTQNAQSTASYLKRQSLLAITGTATGGEDNENRPAAPKDVATGEGQPEGASTGQKITLRNAGEAAAQGGLQALTAWWAKLSAREQKDMSADFSAMRKAARAVDERGGK